MDQTRHAARRVMHPSTILLLASLCAMILGSMAVSEGADRPASLAPASLRVVRYGKSVFIRSDFSSQEDVVVKMGTGTNRQVNFYGTWLVRAAAGMDEKGLSGGRPIHLNGDDSTPWNINGTYIGANHGCSDSRVVTCPGHGKKTADLGSAWQDAAGTKFYLIKIVDENRLWFLSENLGKGPIWKFTTALSGKTLRRLGQPAEIAFTECRMTQLIPACRIAKQEYLVNGTTPLEDGKPAACDHFDIVEEYDIINPGSLLRDFIAHPGQERSFTAEHLDAVIRNHIVYRFHPGGANVIHTTSKALEEFAIGYMGFIQSARLTRGKYDTQEYYIPKTRPFTQDGVSYNFQAIEDYNAPPKSALRFAPAGNNLADPAHLPDRFIQFLSRKENGRTVREVGYALGYSLIHGLTVPEQRARNASSALMLYTSSKSYPTAVDAKMGRIIAAGTQFDCTAYRQYFCPATQENATCCYWHEEHGDTVVYVDYHKAVERDLLRLPANLIGKKLTVIEKTPSLTVHSENAGVLVSVTGDYGYVVFKLR